MRLKSCASSPKLTKIPVPRGSEDEEEHEPRVMFFLLDYPPRPGRAIFQIFLCSEALHCPSINPIMTGTIQSEFSPCGFPSYHAFCTVIEQYATTWVHCGVSVHEAPSSCLANSAGLEKMTLFGAPIRENLLWQRSIYWPGPCSAPFPLRAKMTQLKDRVILSESIAFVLKASPAENVQLHQNTSHIRAAGAHHPHRNQLRKRA